MPSRKTDQPFEITPEELELLRDSAEDREVEAVSADLAEAGLL